MDFLTAQIEGIEWIALLVIVAVLFLLGKKLPELARSLGRSIGEYRKGRLEVEKEIQEQFGGK